MIEALIFDVDGTLAETERDGHRVAFNRAFAEFGLDWYWDVSTYGKLLMTAGGKERIHEYIRVWRPAMPLVRDLAEFVANLHRCKTVHYGEMIETGKLAPRAGVLRLIDEARERGVVLGIASTTSPQNIEALLRSWFGDRWCSVFAAIGAGDVVARKKPDPGIYHYVLGKLGVAPGGCVAIEDSAAGLAAANGAGVEAVVARSEYFRHQSFEGALAVLDELGEPGHPVQGRTAEGQWTGVVTIDTIDGWLRERRVGRGPAPAASPNARASIG
jgi:HAD superfamily hydrolase (TIGR01509 family)